MCIRDRSYILCTYLTAAARKGEGPYMLVVPRYKLVRSIPYYRVKKISKPNIMRPPTSALLLYLNQAETIRMAYISTNSNMYDRIIIMSKALRDVTLSSLMVAGPVERLEIQACS